MRHCFNLVLTLFAVTLIGCSTSPTGRNQLTVFSQGDMAQLGSESFNQIKSKEPIERDSAINAYVKCVAIPVLRMAPGYADPAQWEIVVFKNNDANAFALPGGKIGVYTGILKVAKTSHQLAAVLGHEVGHVVAQHSNERVSEAYGVQGILTLVNLLTKNSESKGTLMAALGVGAQYGVLMPHGRTQESEADIIGLGYMAKAGFNPQESVDLWKNMAANSGGGPPEFLSTHPSSSTRIADLQSHMGEAQGWQAEANRAGRNPNCQNPVK